ncbi:hypothetical protein HXX76_014311 [Chlamydomonas incerta]|uniref:Protein kinase domain-containing protein n=1 Tax=Chlamydomonas incerta TaxID=51695 RepID=A0A835VTH9_CHLIN|nr:hypothetical protein HXX76_014311 [Chlamydomonas incerta]|eukprot:KAG2424736.1 hypothetical protein HXX76_014311 [Chlamydomonas incerta]
MPPEACQGADAAAPVSTWHDVDVEAQPPAPSPEVVKTCHELLPVDQLLADLSVTRILGLGSSSTVYKGVYQIAPAALKVMFNEHSMTPAAVRELGVAMQLRHPNIVTTFTTRAAVITADFLDSLSAVDCWGPAAARELAAPQAQPGSDVGQGPTPLPSPRAAATAVPPETGTAASAPRLQAALADSSPSDDGMGKPGHDPALSWSDAFQRGGAAPGHTVVIIVQGELCEDGTLAAAMSAGMFQPRANRPPALIRRVVLRTAADVCRGMIHMHTCGVLHGDLKPANVLLAKSAKDRRGFMPKVADFGLARVLKEPGASWIQSSPQGSCCYMAPEAFGGAFHRASDVYAFGVLLLELAFPGRRPYQHLNNVQVMMGVLDGSLSPDWPDDQWPELCALGRRCTAWEPRARPSFAELAAALVELEAAVREAAMSERAQQRAAGSALSAPIGDGVPPPGPELLLEPLGAPSAARGLKPPTRPPVPQRAARQCAPASAPPAAAAFRAGGVPAAADHDGAAAVHATVMGLLLLDSAMSLVDATPHPAAADRQGQQGRPNRGAAGEGQGYALES